MIKEASLLVGIVSVMTLVLAPSAETSVPDAANEMPAPNPPQAIEEDFDEDSYWEYDGDDQEEEVTFGEPIDRSRSKVIQSDDRRSLNPALKKKRTSRSANQSNEPEVINYPKPLD